MSITSSGRQHISTDVALSELEHVKNECDTKIKTLEDQILDLHREHQLELDALRSECSLAEAALQKSHNDELSQSRADELARTGAVIAKLKTEQNRRKHVEMCLEELESNFKLVTEQLEQSVSRAEKAENENLLYKVRMREI
jgi:hypothetical protein